MDVKNLTIHDIINYCQEHNEVAWLKATAAKKTEYKVYPRTKVNGKAVADKSQEPRIEYRPISFVQLKMEFLQHFKLAPEPKAKKATMYDLIANL
jgi:hypothetical protein